MYAVYMQYNFGITMYSYFVWDILLCSQARLKPLILLLRQSHLFIEDGEPNEITVKLPWLRRRIEEGLKLFGMQLDHMQCITDVQHLERRIRNEFDVFGIVWLP